MSPNDTLRDRVLDYMRHEDWCPVRENALNNCTCGRDDAASDLRQALSTHQPEEGHKAGDLVAYRNPDMGADISAEIVKRMEGWWQLRFRDGSTAIVRPSQVLSLLKSEASHGC